MIKLFYYVIFTNKRFIPFSTMLVASIVNTPIMRHNEIVEGIGIYDCNKDQIGYSKVSILGINQR